MGAPAATPKESIAYLETTLKKVSEDPEFIKIMADLDQPIMYQNSADFAKFLQVALADYGKLIKDLDIKIE
jgi:tripartite-type tricarboxylate transporter receptor subunit TctC